MASRRTFRDLDREGILKFGDGYRTKRSEHGEPGYRILRVADFRDWSIQADGDDFVSHSFAKFIGNKLSVPGDVLLSTKGTVGRVAVVPDGADQMVYSPQLCFFRVTDRLRLNNRYLAYWFKAPECVDQLTDRAGNTDMAPYVSLRDIGSVSIDLPAIGSQDAIAEVLGALDDKIAANERVLSQCVSLAVAVAGAATAKTTVDDVARHAKRSAHPDSFGVVWHFSLPAFDAGATPIREPGSSIKSSKFILQAPCVLFSKLNPRFPRIWNVPGLPGQESVASTEFVVLEPQSDVSSSELWSVLSAPEVSSTLTARAAGTSGSHQRVRPADILGQTVGDPRSLSSSQRALINGVGDLRYRLLAEAAELARVRDELLPLLMSGKVTVKDAEKVVSDVV